VRVVVTGARGKVGSAAADALMRAGHEVVAVDLGPPEYERGLPGEPHYLRADVADPGQAFAAIHGAEAVVHGAAIPDGFHDPPHTVFANNLMGVFNTLEAAVAAGARRYVNISSETVSGLYDGVRPRYVPFDEEHEGRPLGTYQIAKHMGEQLAAAAAARSTLRCVSLRPSWVQWEGNYERSLGPVVREPFGLAQNLWSYVDVYDLADAIVLAVECDLPGHEAFYVTAADNAAGVPLADLVRATLGDDVELRPTDRPDASGISPARAGRLLGFRPSRSWRDYLDGDGRLLPAAAGRLAELPGRPRIG
jgi:nucleoside-diphosphate-sugar epimerase